MYDQRFLSKFFTLRLLYARISLLANAASNFFPIKNKRAKYVKHDY